MPALKKLQKQKAKLAGEGPKNPAFSRTQLIHLDSLNDIATRDQAEMRKRVMDQIQSRKRKVTDDVADQDMRYGYETNPTRTSVKTGFASNSAGAAILKQFQ